jgi:hypothetical protein
MFGIGLKHYQDVAHLGSAFGLQGLAGEVVEAVGE